MHIYLKKSNKILDIIKYLIKVYFTKLKIYLLTNKKHEKFY